MEKLNDDWVNGISTCPKIKQHSQTGEEGIIKFILDSIGHGNKFLVDIGAWDGEYLSNTKMFLDSFGYSGILIDGNNHGNENVMQEWITKDNVCDILKKYNCPKEFSLLSYDTDGNDYWILTELLRNYRPSVIICEINGTIPLGICKAIKYNESHVWKDDDYYGFSFDAGIKLAYDNGYIPVYQNDSLNLYLVAKEYFLNPKKYINIPFEAVQYHPHNEKGEWINVL